MNSGYFYWYKTGFNFSSTESKDYENPFSFAEADAAKKVPITGRVYNPSREIYLNVGAMKRLKKSYERVLYLAAKYPLTDGNGFVPPTYAV